MLVDCHAHLASPKLASDRRDVLQRAAVAGVAAILVVAEDLADCEAVLALARRGPRPALIPCFGLHPDRFAEERPLPTPEEVAAIEALARQHRAELGAIGEVGLDRWWVRTPARRSAQVALLERMAALAVELHLPLNVHSRSAGHYTLDLLLASGVRRVLMHAFDGRASHAARAAEQGFIFSVPPSVVRSEQKQKLVRRLPLGALALETDSPVLAAVRGARNEPANVLHSLRFIAAAHGVSEERVAEVTTGTARRLFPVLDRLMGDGVG